MVGIFRSVSAVVTNIAKSNDVFNKWRDRYIRLIMVTIEKLLPLFFLNYLTFQPFDIECT